ncbi:pyridoxamine phosphate oxidase [Niveomyces insectorum RCEF 264]|uniref:pyridoxal 5'-phosphate synthase n=1 Tax=Niveomyces insectorum RCEF 264 TaxID=1081102 RepID=A0A167VG21_9HYPO|nr:pyridoxamine phosphate oxidase [Niveomyces insectorum RCEF 264]
MPICQFHSKQHDHQPRRTHATTAAQRKQHPAIARRASVGGGDASGSGVSSGNDDDSGHATTAHRPRPPRAGQFQRHEQHAGGLRRADLDPRGPITQFHAWFAEAKGLRDAHDGRPAVPHPETCTLSTASLPSGRVSARVVYLKELDHQGFVLYSNFGTSRKAADLFNADHPNPRWSGRGAAARLPAAESQVYFDTRVRGSRIGAWASRQSAVLQPATGASGTDEKIDTADADADADDGRAQLDKWVAEVEARFGPSKAADGDDGGEVDDDHIPVPPFWGGLRIVPERVEFWQGRHNRLHDRFVYTRVHNEGSEESEDNAKIADATWTLERLSP